jgi:hypothetical protein
MITSAETVSSSKSGRLMHTVPKRKTKYLHFSQVNALFPLIKFSFHFFNSDLDKENIIIDRQ